MLKRYNFGEIFAKYITIYIVICILITYILLYCVKVKCQENFYFVTKRTRTKYYAIICAFLLVAEFANKVLIRSGHQNGGLERGNKKKRNGQIRAYGAHMA